MVLEAVIDFAMVTSRALKYTAGRISPFNDFLRAAWVTSIRNKLLTMISFFFLLFRGW